MRLAVLIFVVVCLLSFASDGCDAVARETFLTRTDDGPTKKSSSVSLGAVNCYSNSQKNNSADDKRVVPTGAFGSRNGNLILGNSTLPQNGNAINIPHSLVGFTRQWVIKPN
ncbi:hypothetical protein L1049_001180 [Liquidambar formosana]|uniref:Uncharacterized protein n=1 Tax=Liquidambar formosana TaxID=63359 RepID=A0AAP0NBZ8_LIQFO